MRTSQKLEYGLLTLFANSNGKPCTIIMEGSNDVLTLIPNDTHRCEHMSKDEIMKQPLNSFFPLKVTYDSIVFSFDFRYRFYNFITNYDCIMHGIKSTLLPYFNKYIKGHTTREIEKPTDFVDRFDKFDNMYKSFFHTEHPVYDGTLNNLVIAL